MPPVPTAKTTGKRETRKHQTRAALLSAAQRLFATRGYDQTRIEDIAEAAGIAVGTCYNYFDRKADLLIALVLDADRSAIAGAETIFDDLPDDPALALQAIALHDSRHSLAALDKPSWRQVLAAILDGPDSGFARIYAETTAELRSLMTRCVLHLQARGTVRQDLDAAQVAQTVFAAKYMLFIDHVSDDAAPLAQHEAEVCSAISIIVDGLRPAGPAPCPSPA